MAADKMGTRDLWLAGALGVVLAAVLWWVVAHPRTVEASWQGPLKSASFAPFREGQSPLVEVFPSPEQIEEDLVRLKGLFEGIRTYTSTGGMDVVPALAAKHGFALTHSAWLGREAERNERDVQALIVTANRYPEAVKRVIVGNEVLLRGDLSPDQLIHYIDQVRGAIKQPVSYADVWAFWLKYPQVAEHVDYITIHILPYWEDEPVSVEDAQRHLLEIIERIRTAFPNKPILVGETGWPTEGRSRGPAHANTLVAAQFVRALPALAAEHHFDYNVVEAYDQPWKARLEGTVGARWGLFDADRKQKYSLTGPVSPLPNATARAVASIVVGLVLAIALVPLSRTRTMAMAVAVCTQWIGMGLVESVYHAIRLTVSPTSATWVIQHVLFALHEMGLISQGVVDALYKPLLQDAVGPMAVVWGYAIALFAVVFVLLLVRWSGAVMMGTRADQAERWGRSGFGVYAVAVMVFAVFFATSGRYMDIPLPHLWLPLGAAALLYAIGRWQPRADSARCAVYTQCRFFNRHAIWLLPTAALGCLWGEVGAMLGGADFISMHPTLALQAPLIARSLLANTELLVWCLASVLFVIPFARGCRWQPAEQRS